MQDRRRVWRILSLLRAQRGPPLLVAGRHREGPALAWTSNMSEHWLPATFLAWEGYDRLFGNMITWAAGDL